MMQSGSHLETDGMITQGDLICKETIFESVGREAVTTPRPEWRKEVKFPGTQEWILRLSWDKAFSWGAQVVISTEITARWIPTPYSPSDILPLDKFHQELKGPLMASQIELPRVEWGWREDLKGANRNTRQHQELMKQKLKIVFLDN